MKHVRAEQSWDIIIGKLGNFNIKRGITSFVNPYSIDLLKKSVDIANGVDYWYVDGIWLVKVINKTLKKNINRFSFDDTSVAPLVFKFARENKLNIGLIGTKEGVIEQAAKNLGEAYDVKFNYVRHGYFNSAADMDEALQILKDKDISVVICGMGTPKQEEFLITLKKSGWNGYGYTCGGYLHQSAQKVGYYPSFFDKYNIRWVYRIYSEPQLFKRYLIKYPLFFMRYGSYMRKKQQKG
ncbi:WecB/TagA/CpsF family glycosyltransferase [Mucilaginibacter sp. X5P1]|uniref:WecB/TagA/CpsF family glycosyltransferase n=1 Tax=Mucilaginibacter sp. X5P1 TaxID=2723088 RepID=UPI001609ADAE|nr:WecB/TagA/CpsF family glycosyltransferase [Mucilaginibacter sp. X5P1]MBB6141202.1 N-acetylglucosaminyldiphosphoundecaprenol N-acetyl-beta-D-mannosaminyltransferase [Mucilaginibacter sp. X5P1]